MPVASGFSIQSIEIEGFKGFAEPSQIRFAGRHVFLLGPNGNGKSSIVEAIRWGLLGSTFRPNEIVDNLHYPGTCRVVIELVRGEDRYKLRRTLNPGAGSTSVPVLTDQYGKDVLLRSVLPQLTSVDAGEGTHIIFAPQSAPLTKQPEDIKPFERTIFNYLGLTHPRALMSNIDEFLIGETKSEEDFDKQLSAAHAVLDRELAGRQGDLGQILEAPPWDGNNIPSTAESEQKVRTFVREITDASPDEDGLAGLTLTPLLSRAQQALDEKKNQSQGNLEEEKSELEARRRRLQDLRDIQGQVTYLESRLEDSRSRLQALLDGLTLSALKEMLKTAQYETDTASIKKQIVQYTLMLLERSESDAIDCPVCDKRHSRDVLESSLQDIAQSDDTSSMVTSLASRIEECDRLDALCTEQESELQSQRNKETLARSNMSAEDKRRLSQNYTIDQLIEDYEKRELGVTEQITGYEAWLRSRQTELNKLKSEGRFQQIRESLQRLESDKIRLEDIQASYDNLVQFGESVREIQKASEDAFSEQFGKESPRLSRVLSKSFNALTRHPWYDRLVVLEGKGKLEYRVASTHNPQGLGDPTGVLNGQAESALGLVPHFAFSQNDDNIPTEVYVVMLDDPTRALDTDHIKIFVERLQELGNSVQLVVASQETERFQEMIPQAFDPGSYIVVEPTGWSPGKSPTLNIQ